MQPEGGGTAAAPAEGSAGAAPPFALDMSNVKAILTPPSSARGQGGGGDPAPWVAHLLSAEGQYLCSAALSAPPSEDVLRMASVQLAGGTVEGAVLRAEVQQETAPHRVRDGVGGRWIRDAEAQLAAERAAIVRANAAGRGGLPAALHTWPGDGRPAWAPWVMLRGGPGLEESGVDPTASRG